MYRTRFLGHLQGVSGRENDGLGFYYYRNRFYAPATARFLTPDPLDLSAGRRSQYSYAANNPLGFKDPYGLFLIGGIGGATANGGVVFGGAGDVQALGGIAINSEGIGVGAAAGGGLAVGGPSAAIGLPGGFNNPGVFVLGLAASLGGGGFISNARTFADLEGPFRTRQLNVGPVSLQLDTSGNTWIFSITGGKGGGLSYVDFTTVTPKQLIVQSPMFNPFDFVPAQTPPLGRRK